MSPVRRGRAKAGPPAGRYRRSSDILDRAQGGQPPRRHPPHARPATAVPHPPSLAERRHNVSLVSPASDRSNLSVTCSIRTRPTCSGPERGGDLRIDQHIVAAVWRLVPPLKSACLAGSIVSLDDPNGPPSHSGGSRIMRSTLSGASFGHPVVMSCR
jgi:hypothetical protein